jgi:hypothetical protein
MYSMRSERGDFGSWVLKTIDKLVQDMLDWILSLPMSMEDC